MSGIKEIIEKWQNWAKNRKVVISRLDYKIKLSKEFAFAFIGVRRCGKTYVALENAFIQSKKILYMNFEDPYFIGENSVNVLDKILQNYIAIYKYEPEVLVLDEIYNIDKWEKWVRSQVDIGKYFIIITGSSAKLLSSELSTSLTGRSREVKVFPLSFKEFLHFKKIDLKTISIYEILAHLESYMQYGGFPKVILNEEEESSTLLEQNLNDIIYKDIVQRYQIRNILALRLILKYYLTNISSLHSFNSIKNAFNINLDTVQEYASHFSSTFLLFFIPKYTFNLKEQSRSSNKVYSIDSGLRNIYSNTLDKGKIIENIIYLDLLRREKEVFYHQGKFEVDFICIKGLKVSEIIQVSYSNLDNPNTLKREVNGLIEAMEKYKLNKSFLLTENLDEVRKFDNKKIIEFKPVWKFLLEGRL